LTYLNSNWRFDSEIVGEGLIRAGCRAVATTNARGGLVLTANNANFHGKVEVAYDPVFQRMECNDCDPSSRLQRIDHAVNGIF